MARNSDAKAWEGSDNRQWNLTWLSSQDNPRHKGGGIYCKVSLWGPKPALKLKVGADKVCRAAERLILETVQTAVTV